MEFRKHQLDNGLEIVAEVNPQAYSAAVGFFVKTGSRDEDAENNGVSHFLEHMVFKGTPKRTAADVNRELDEMGSQSNAYTSEEQTVYHAAVLPEFQDQIVELLSDLLRPSLREDDFETEKKVILEEIAKYDDQPPFGAYERALAAYFGDHPLSRPILGTVDSVQALTPERMRRYFDNRYSPGNITLVATGNIDFEALIRQADQYCGQWPKEPLHRDINRPETLARQEQFQHELARQQYIVQVGDGPSAEDPRRHIARLIYSIVGDDSGSRLYWELVDTGLAEYAVLGPHEYQGCGLVLGFFSCSPEQASANLARAHAILEKAQNEGVTEEELERAKSKICSSIVLSSERPYNRLFSIGNNWIQRNDYRTVRESVERYQRITLQETREVLESFPLRFPTTIQVGPA